MTAPRTLLAAASCLALSTAPALADLTPAEAWADWQDLVGRYGATLETAGLDQTDGAVSARGVVVTFDLPEEGSMRMEVGDLAFRALGDGRVEVEMANRMPLSMQTPSEEGDGMASVSMVLVQDGMRMIVSGDAQARSYDYDAASFGVTDVAVDDPGAEVEVDLSLDVRMQTVSGRTTLSGEDAVEFDATLDAEAMTATMTGSGLDENGEPASFDLSAEVKGLTESVSGRFDRLDSETSLAKMVAAGLGYAGRMGYDAAAYQVSGEGPDGPFRLTGTAEAGTLDVSLGEDGLSYATQTGPQSLQITGGEVPFPLSFTIGESGGAVRFPVLPGEAQQDVSLKLRMVDLVLDDTIWNMIDPSEQVKRDPATVVLDLDGAVVLREDIFDPAYAASPSGAPGTIEAVTLNELRIELAGAALSGTGDVGFIQTPLMPQPVGQVDLMLTGGNALIDTLVNLGVLPEQQAMGARMMMGLFARPGTSDDQLLTTIEMREDGSILANGQRIR